MELNPLTAKFFVGGVPADAMVSRTDFDMSHLIAGDSGKISIGVKN